MKCYAVAELDVTDRSWVREYIHEVTRMVERRGGRYLARANDLQRLEGERENRQIFLIIEWPSKEAAKAFYDSEEYRPYRSRRLAGSKGDFVLVSGNDIHKLANIPSERSGVVLKPGEGRAYPMGRIAAVFKADGAETAGGYSISEWWLEPQTKGPGAHSHPEDDVFYVIEGTMSFLMGNKWLDAAKGSFVLVPGGLTHDFENRSAARAGVLNFSIPGGFEPNMPDIARWFAEHPPGDAHG